MNSVIKKVSAAVILFTFCGMCGWIYETAVTSYLWGRFAERGFLHIPVLPIYGVFAFLMLPLFRKHKGWLTVFLGGMAFTTALEFVCSYLIEWVFGEGLWSYSNWDFNYDGRISLYSSLVFGVFSVILIRLAYPAVKKMYEKAPSWILYTIGTIFAAAIISDFIYVVMYGK